MEEQRFDFSVETEEENTVEQPESKPGKKARKKLFFLLVCVAVVAAIGGAALKSAIRAISDRNAALQENTLPSQSSANDAGKEETEKEEPQTVPQKPYTLEKTGLPETLPSREGAYTLTPAEVYAQNVETVVCIETEMTVYGMEEAYAAGSTGSGFVLSEDGYILTNCHMVTDAEHILVTLYSGEEFDAEVVGADEMGDVALLKIEAEGLQTVTIAEEDSVQVGDEVVAIGNPFGELEYTMTHGYISGLNREVTVSSTPIRMMQTDAAINSGNSGGPMLDMNGNVVGIASAKYSGTSSSGAIIENVGFAIPIHDALKIVYDLQDYGYVRGRAYLGVTVRDLDAAVAKDYGLPVGPRVESIVEGSCSEKAGMQAGDIILAVGERETKNTTELLAALRDYSAGDNALLKIFRAGAELEVSVVLDERPLDPQVFVPDEG